MRIVVEKGKMCGAMWQWCRFVVCNPDITFAVNRAPLQMQKLTDKEFSGSGYHISIKMRVVASTKPDPSDEVQVVTDVKMPLGLGQTYTVGHYRYCATDVSTTMVGLNLSLDTVGIFMPIYFGILKRRIDNFINKVMTDNERASVLLQENDLSLKELLNEEQIARIERYRRKCEDALHSEPHVDVQSISLPKLQDQQEWHPELVELTALFERMQGKESSLEQELVRIREMRDAVATLLVARRMLEVIVTQICEEKLNRPRGTEPLAGILGKIGREQIVPDYVVTSMENLNRLSTYGAHPKAFSPRQVREALLALCSIMEWYVSVRMKPNRVRKEGQ